MSLTRLLASCSLFVALMLSSGSASAFSIRVHVYLANAIHDDLARNMSESQRPLVRLMQPDSAEAVWVELNPLDARAILENLAFFRGGAIGPDNTVMTGLTDPSHAWAFRPFQQCQALVGEAAAQEQRQRDSGIAEEELDLSERAYALGCYLHGISDNAAHHVVNFLAGQTFTFYPQEAMEAGSLKWSMLNVARHIVVESNFESSLIEQDAGFTGDGRFRPGVMTLPLDNEQLTHKIAIDLVRRVYFDPSNTTWTGLWHGFADDHVLAKKLKLRLELGLAPTGGIVQRLLESDDVWVDDSTAVSAYVDFLANGFNGVAFTPADYIIFLPELTADIKIFYEIVNEQGKELAQTISSLFPITKSMLQSAFAPRDAQGEIDWNGTEPSNFEGVMAIKFAQLDSFVVKYLESIQNLSNLNITTGLLASSSEERAAALTPLTDSVEVVTTINYPILFSDDVNQLFANVGDLIGVLDGLFEIITDRVQEYVLGNIRVHLDNLKAQFDPLKLAAESYVKELEQQVIATLGLELGTGVFDTYLESVLYMNAYNSVAGAIANNGVVVANSSGFFAGPVSFDASYQLEYNQLALCPDLRAVFYPCGANAGDMLQGNYRTCQPLADVLNPVVECHDVSAVQFAAMPTPENCEPTALEEFLDDETPDQGSSTLAFPPGPDQFGGEQPACHAESAPPLVDDGVVGGGSGGGNGPGGDDDDDDDDDGEEACGCTVPGKSTDPNAIAWLLAMAALLLTRSRRRGSRA